MALPTVHSRPLTSIFRVRYGSWSFPRVLSLPIGNVLTLSDLSGFDGSTQACTSPLRVPIVLMARKAVSRSLQLRHDCDRQKSETLLG